MIKQRNDDDSYIIDNNICYICVKYPNQATYQYLIKNVKRKLVLNSIKIKRLLLNIQIICSLSIKILKSTTYIKKPKVLTVFGHIIAGMISNKKFN